MKRTAAIIGLIVLAAMIIISSLGLALTTSIK